VSVEREKARPILPGSTIGIFGGGQLGRMMAMAARSLGYKLCVLDPDAGCPAGYVVDEVIEAGWNDAWNAANLARKSDVVTLEIEQIAIASLDAAAKLKPVRPGPAMLAIIQDKTEQKNWLRKNGFPTGDFRVCHSIDQLREAIPALGGRCFIKSAKGGYDGRGQAKVGFDGEPFGESVVRAAWADVGETSCVAEKALDLAKEISILVSRSPAGEVQVFPTAENFHENQILSWSVIPAAVSTAMETKARKIAEEIADTFVLEGLLAVEMFVTTDGELLVNELAPRPHNSYHGSERACVTSQFEQAIRAACDLPLGDASLVQPTAIANLLGDLWLKDGEEKLPHFEAALAVPTVRLHLYEKLTARVGRKMGHLSAVGANGEEALRRVLEAKGRL
jgi:5-(carboxyamino)imidazole ribonucleotide synthase